MDEVGMGGSELTLAMQSVVTYLIVQLARKVAPGFWDGLGGRFKKMITVAVSSVAVAVVTGLIAGHGWDDISTSAIASFAGAVALRQATKTKLNIQDTPAQTQAKGRVLGFKSKAPNVISERDL